MVAKPAKAAATTEAETVPAAPISETGIAMPPEPVETTVPAKGSVTVKFRGEDGFETERSFSKDVHGTDFAKLAKEFAENMQSQGRLIA
jgi:hypothetical protein